MRICFGLMLLFLLCSASPCATAEQPGEYATAAELGLMEGYPPPKHKRVDRSNAIIGVPYNRWSYQHMRRVYPSGPILPAAEPIHLKRDIDSRISKLVMRRGDGSASNMPTYLKETYTDAFVVIQGDTIVYERYANGMTPDQPHQMMSVTKSFAGLLGRQFSKCRI